MWLVKKAASKVTKLSQKVMREESEGEKMIKEIISNKHKVMPTKKMSQLTNLSYDMDRFEQIVQFVKEKLEDLKMEKKSLKKRLNLLVLTSYLIKHGASGFIDEFRNMQDTFTKYQILAISDSQEEKDLYPLKLEVSQRANNIKTLLTDKRALALEKELARKIKEKIMTQGGDYSQHSKQKDEEKVESFLQHYVWRYTSKLDKKLDDVADALISKIDFYLDEEIPESFEIDQIEEQKKTIKTGEGDLEVRQKCIQEEKNFMKEKVPLDEGEKKKYFENLIELAQRHQEKQQKEQDKVSKEEGQVKKEKPPSDIEKMRISETKHQQILQ